MGLATILCFYTSESSSRKSGMPMFSTPLSSYRRLRISWRTMINVHHFLLLKAEAGVAQAEIVAVILVGIRSAACPFRREPSPDGSDVPLRTSFTEASRDASLRREGKRDAANLRYVSSSVPSGD